MSGLRVKKDGKTLSRYAAVKTPDEEVEQKLKEEADSLKVSLMDEVYVSPYDSSMSFSRLIFIARRQAGMTTEEAAANSEVPYSTYLVYESGRGLPKSKRHVDNICMALGIDPVLARKELEKSAMAKRHICILSSERKAPAMRMQRINLFAPSKVYTWLETEAEVRGLTINGFAALLLSMNYRLAMRKLTDPANELEAEYDTVNAETTKFKLYVHDEDKDGAASEDYFLKSHSDYEWAG